MRATLSLTIVFLLGVRLYAQSDDTGSVAASEAASTNTGPEPSVQQLQSAESMNRKTNDQVEEDIKDLTKKVDILRRDQKKIVNQLDEAKAEAAAPKSGGGTEPFLIKWNDADDAGGKLIVRITKEGLVLEPEEDDEEFSVEWEMTDRELREAERQEDKDSRKRLAPTERKVKFGKVKFGKLKGGPQLGISYNWAFAAGSDQCVDLANQYSLDILFDDAHELSMIIGHTLGIDDFRKWRLSYQYLMGPGPFKFGIGLETGFAKMERSDYDYDPYSGYSYDHGDVRTSFGPKLSWGFWWSQFHIELEDVVSFAPGFMNEIGLGFGVLF